MKVIKRDGKTFVEIGQNETCDGCILLERRYPFAFCKLFQNISDVLQIGDKKHKDCPSLKD